MATYLSVKSKLRDGKTAVHDTHPDHPPSASFPEGGAVVIDQADRSFTVASTKGIHNAIARGLLTVVSGEVDPVKALRACAAEAIDALKVAGKPISAELAAMVASKAFVAAASEKPTATKAPRKAAKKK